MHHLVLWFVLLNLPRPLSHQFIVQLRGCELPLAVFLRHSDTSTSLTLLHVNFVIPVEAEKYTGYLCLSHSR